MPYLMNPLQASETLKIRKKEEFLPRTPCQENDKNSAVITFLMVENFRSSRLLWSISYDVGRIRTYACFYQRTHDLGHEYVETCSHLFPMVFQSFQNFSSFIILYCLKTYCYVFDLRFICLSLEETDSLLYICFKATLFFNISYKLFNKKSLPQSFCQFRVS